VCQPAMRVIRQGDDVLAIVTGVPSRIRGLKMAPNTMEDFLKRGKWIVVNFNVNSARDMVYINKVLLPIAGKVPVNVAFRPFADSKEIERWVQVGPEYRDVLAGFPIWLILKDGRVDRAYEGVLYNEELKFVLERAESGLRGTP
jgi:hypothetical protein